MAYHHDMDQEWYREFVRRFCSTLDLVTNRSLKEPVDSDQVDYVHRKIRERNIRGSSVTIVLCGSETWKRKWVDWEIGSTVNMKHGLLGIGLPTISYSGSVALVPDRLFANHQCGYAGWIWWPQTGRELADAIRGALAGRRSYGPDNALPFMSRDRP